MSFVVQSKVDPKKSKKQKRRYDTLAISAREATIEREQDILIKQMAGGDYQWAAMDHACTLATIFLVG